MLRPFALLGLMIAIALPVTALAAPQADPFETGEGVTLPAGRLQMVSGNSQSAYFIALDQVTRDGDQIDLWSFTVYEPAQPVGTRRVAQAVTHLTLDCRERSVHVLGVAGFDEAGKVVVTLPARAHEEEPIEPDNTYDYFSRVLCDGVQLPPSNTFKGHRAALAAGRIGIARMPPR